MNFIKKYFEEKVEFPMKEMMDDSILKDGFYFVYVPSTFLNAFINHVEPVKSFIIDRYFDEDSVIVLDKSKDIKVKTKQEAIDILNKECNFYHTKIGVFDDDVLFLGKSEKYYWMFWFDMDNSDCCIGRFSSKDIDENKLIQDFKEWCQETSDDKIYEFKKEWFKGWISF